MNKKEQIVTFYGPYITLGQLLKKTNLVLAGGEVKLFLLEHDILVDGEKESRRGRKLYDRSIISVDGVVFKVMQDVNW